jgi:Zn-dependent protease with chaperone function
MALTPDDARARRYARIRLAFGLAGLALSVGYLVSLLATGASALLAAALAAWTPRPWLQFALMLGILAAGWRLLSLPLTWLGSYWLPRRYGLLHQPFRLWLWDALKATAIGAPLALAGAELAYALLRLTPWWWLASALAFFGAAVLLTLVAPVWLLPLFYRLAPLPDGPLRARLVALAARAGVPVLGVWVGDHSRKSRTANAAVTGLGRTRRIILFDTLLRDFSEDEVEAVLAHELAHHAHADMWRGLAVQGAVTLATFWVADRALAAGAAGLGLSGPADLGGLPLVGLIVLAAGLITLPLVNGWSRRVERQADDFAVRVLGRAGAFVSAMERLARQNLAERNPHPLKELLFYSHPAIGRRIARAQMLESRSAH